MGHITHLRNHFKLRNTYGYIIKLIREKTPIISYLKFEWSLFVKP